MAESCLAYLRSDYVHKYTSQLRISKAGCGEKNIGSNKARARLLHLGSFLDRELRNLNFYYRDTCFRGVKSDRATSLSKSVAKVDAHCT